MKRVPKGKVDTIEKLAILVADGFEQVDKRFEQVDKRFEQVDRHFERIEARLTRIELELEDIHRRLAMLDEQGARQAGYAKEIDYTYLHASLK